MYVILFQTASQTLRGQGTLQAVMFQLSFFAVPLHTLRKPTPLLGKQLNRIHNLAIHADLNRVANSHMLPKRARVVTCGTRTNFIGIVSVQAAVGKERERERRKERRSTQNDEEITSVSENSSCPREKGTYSCGQ